MQSHNTELSKLVAIALRCISSRNLSDKNPVSKDMSENKEEIIRIISLKAKEQGVNIPEDERLTSILSVLELNKYISLEIYTIIAEIIALLLKENPAKKI